MDEPRILTPDEHPPLLREIPEPPAQLYLRGALPPADHVCLCIVGSRNYTDYGKEAVKHLVGGLSGAPVAVISGLARGIDGQAHEAALQAGLYTLALPGSGIDEQVLYPRSNRTLARRIVAAGGGLLCEHEPLFQATPWSFPRRNRLMAGMSRAVLVIEAKERSGTLITARLAVEYNRELFVVPGSIFHTHSKGPHQFLRLGATPVTSAADILEALSLEHATKTQTRQRLPQEQQALLDFLDTPKTRDEITRHTGRCAAEVGALLMRMELEGHVVTDAATGMVRTTAI